MTGVVVEMPGDKTLAYLEDMDRRAGEFNEWLVTHPREVKNRELAYNTLLSRSRHYTILHRLSLSPTASILYGRVSAVPSRIAKQMTPLVTVSQTPVIDHVSEVYSNRRFSVYVGLPQKEYERLGTPEKVLVQIDHSPRPHLHISPHPNVKKLEPVELHFKPIIWDD